MRASIATLSDGSLATTKKDGYPREGSQGVKKGQSALGKSCVTVLKILSHDNLLSSEKALCGANNLYRRIFHVLNNRRAKRSPILRFSHGKNSWRFCSWACTHDDDVAQHGGHTAVNSLHLHSMIDTCQNKVFTDQ